MSESKTIKHLGLFNAVPAEPVLRAAGVDSKTHDILTWHQRPEVKRAQAEGRIVARFKVRFGDPECYVVWKA